MNGYTRHSDYRAPRQVFEKRCAAHQFGAGENAGATRRGRHNEA